MNEKCFIGDFAQYFLVSVIWRKERVVVSGDRMVEKVIRTRWSHDGRPRQRRSGGGCAKVSTEQSAATAEGRCDGVWSGKCGGDDGGSRWWFLSFSSLSFSVWGFAANFFFH
ncbi:hypothetical protein SESBI_39152 [Sesbania bispinosa]|nr:hypothetical protein SESBI_39152 [Sesbania bispinosa]